MLLEDDELDSVALESTRTIDIEIFRAGAKSIDWIWYDTPYYLMPTIRSARRPFASSATPWARPTWSASPGSFSTAASGRSCSKPRDKGIVLWTLRYGDEVRDPDDYFGRSAT